MKKLFLGVLAIAGLVACVQEDVLGTQNLQNEIGFSGYVGKQVRSDADPSMTLNDLNHFHVWAYVASSAGNVLENEVVSKSGDAWTYTNIQYWVKGHTYRFFALANADENVTIAALDGDKLTNDPYGVAGETPNGLGEIAFTNNDGTQDVLYSSYEVYTSENHNETVAFNFDHILSKVKFTFKNGFATNNINLVVTDIKMTAPKTATTTLAVSDHGYTWAGHDDTTTLAFGNAAGAARIAANANGVSDKARLTIPAGADQEYTVTFKVEQYVGDVNLNAGAPVQLTSTIKGVTFEAGKAYNFVATVTPESLDLKEIVFAEPTIDEWNNADINLGEVGNTEVHVVYSAEQLQTVLDEAANGTVSAVFGKSFGGAVTVLQKEGVNLIIDGAGFEYTGTILVNGNARANGAETLTIQNINFKAAEKCTFIEAPSKVNDKYNYSHNVTVKGCTFTGLQHTWTGVKAEDEPYEVGCVSLTGTYNAVVKNCTATNVHSLCQFQSVDNTVLVENVTVVNGKNGVSFGNTAFPTLRNANIQASFYGVRGDGNAARGKLILENADITAKQPVIVRKVTTAGYSVSIDAESELVTAEPIHVIFTKGSDDAEYVAPAVEFAYNVPAQYYVYPANVVDSVETLNAALANAEVTNVLLLNSLNAGADASLAHITSNKVIDFNNQQVTVGGNGFNYALYIHNGCEVTIDDANIVGGGIQVYDGAKLVYNGGTFATKWHDTSRYHFMAFNGGEVVVNGGEFSVDRTSVYYAYVDATSKLTINGGYFHKKVLANNATKDAPFKYAKGAQIVITGGTFGFDPSQWVAPGFKAEKNGSVWNVVAGETVADTAALENALTAGETSINLAAGEYTMPAASKFTAETVINCAEGVVFTGTSKLNINGATIVGATFSNPSGTAVDQTINGTFKGCKFEGSNGARWCYAGETVVFEDCVFSGSVYGVHFDGGANDVIFRNCEISGFNTLGGALTMVTFEGCTFKGNGKSGYNGANLWGSTKLINCEFTFDGTTANEWIDFIDAGKTYEVTNCTVNGVAFTANNAKGYDNFSSRSNAVVKINGVDYQF